MKKLIALILMAAMLVTVFAGCAVQSNDTDGTQTPSATDPTQANPTDPSTPTSPSDPTVPDKKDTVTIYASVPSDWTAPYCWAWAGTDKNAFDAWPGVAMTKNGQWYTIEVPSWVENVIISNNGTPQTQDLAITKGSNAWVVVSSAGIGSVYDAEPSPSLPTDADMETKLNAELDALIASIGDAIDTSVFDRDIGKISSTNSGSRYSDLTARQGASTITSVKMEDHVFMGADDITVGQLVAKGWSCKALEQKISPNYVASTLGSTPSGNKFSWRGWNNTNEEIPLKDCIVAGFDLDYDLGDRAQPYINDTLITKDTTLLQFLDSVGCPSKIQITQNFEDGECQTSFIYLTYNNLEVVFRAFQGSTVLYSISLEL